MFMDNRNADAGQIAIVLDGVVCMAGGRAVLEIPQLHVAQGERVAVVGHNGAGKSTFLRLLTGFMVPAHGRVQVLDHQLAHPVPAEALRALRQEVGQVFLDGEVPAAEERGSVFGAWLEPRTLLVGLIVLAAALTEGSANDWVGLAVADGFAKDEATGAMALTVFLVAMTGMRLLGTNLLDRLGRVTVLRLLGGLAFSGLALFAFAPWMWLALVGVVLWGFGAALGFPVGMSAAADDPRRAAARVSVVSTIGYTAFFMGPPLIGLLAEHLGYRHALATILVPVALGLVIASAATPLSREPRDTVEG